MRLAHLLGIGMLVAAVLMTGCTGELREQNALLMEENEDLRAQLSDRDSALDSAVARAREREEEASRLRRELRELERRQAEQPDTGFEGIAGVTGSRGAGEVTATIESDILFDSGSAELRPAARQALDEVAGVLTSRYSGNRIRVAGHTDTDPIRQSGFESNYHLGFERAYAVRDYLIEGGVPRERLYLASYGPHVAKDTKAESRRVEIIVALND